MKHAEKISKQFAAKVRKDARANLTRKGKRVSSDLYKSLDYTVEFDNDRDLTPNIKFFAAEYADFVDQGVKGKESSLKAPLSPFRFGSGNFKGKGNEFKRRIDGWIKSRRLFLRDEKGRFKKGGIETLSFLIRRSIYNKGIAPTYFFSRPFEKEFKRFPEQIAQAIARDLDDTIEDGTTNR